MKRAEMKSDVQWATPAGAMALAMFPFALVVLLPEATTRFLVSEDSVVEWIGALAWLAASCLFAATLVRQRQAGVLTMFGAVCLVALTMMCFVAAGEEISWGQRLVGYDTPGVIARTNLQSEMNLHNTELLDVRTSLDGDKKAGLARWLTFNRLSSLIWLGYLVVSPLVVRFVPLVRSLVTRWGLPIPPPEFAAAAAANYAAFSVLLASLTAPDTTQKTLNVAANEVKESVIAVLFAAAAYACFHRIRNSAGSPHIGQPSSFSSVPRNVKA